MFTGIIEELGIVKKINDSELSVSSKLNNTKIGDSIAVNGVCLTIHRFNRSSVQPLMSFDLSEETLKKTNLGELKIGNKVNLERALKVGEHLGGHFVTGHIEGMGKILSVKSKRNTDFFEFSAPPGLAPYLVPKGSIAVDGISLTIVNITNQRANQPTKFTVAVIPCTLENTTLGLRKVNDTVNLEPDILAKYLENVLEMKKIDPLRQSEARREKEINLDFLKKTGF